MMTCMFFGPWAGLTMVCSMSAVRDGPEIMFTVRGMLPSPMELRNLLHASS